MKITRFTNNPFEEHTYILWDEESLECAIIDPGCYTRQEQQQIVRFISDNKLQVRHLMLTHLHLDHYFGVPFISRTYGIQPEASPADEPLLEIMTRQAQMFGTPLPDAPIPTGSHLHGGETVYIGNEPIEIRSVPGHTPGGLAFYMPRSGYVCCGDSLFRGSIGRTDLPGGDFTELIHSLHGQLATLPPETIVYPGHGPETTIGEELRCNPYLQ